MAEIFSIITAAALTENYILAKFLGICPFIGVSKRLKTAFGMSLAVVFVMVISTAVTYPIYKYVLEPNGLTYLQTIVFILVIAALVQLVEIFMKKIFPPLYNALGIYLPLITTNCAVLGITMLVIDKSGVGYGYPEALANAFGSGLGYMLAMVLFAGVRERLENADIPQALKGLPITAGFGGAACRFLFGLCRARRIEEGGISYE